VKLRELEAEFLRYTGTGTHLRGEVPLAEADGILFLCPKCYAANGGQRPGVHSVICWFRGRVPDDALPGPGRWTPSGTGLDDLTFIPGDPPRACSVLLTGGGCDWHGFVTNGEAS